MLNFKYMNTKISLATGNCYIEYFQLIDENLRINSQQFQELWDLHPSEFGKIRIFGKTINTPRYFQNYGHAYNFSGKNHSSIPVPEILQPFLDWVNLREPDYNFNGILVNWYQDGSHYIGFHSDDEKSLVKNSPIYCFSLGQERNFVVQSKSNKEDKRIFVLQNNSLIIMGGECQRFYKHSIPKVSGKNCSKMKSRISITIRAFK